MSLTMTDHFCGAGGSTTGAVQVPGVEVVIAANHWQKAVDVHNANHPSTDHAAVDLHEENPRFFPRTDILWASPECTKWSQAGASHNRPAIDEGLFADPNADDVATRSRLLMFDVLRFVEHHRYDMVVVENVVDIAVSAKYATAWAEWTRQFRNLGYHLRPISLNSMHAQMLGLPAPQSRDRLYVVAWRHGVKPPDLERVTRPRAWCPRCERMVESRQSWKNGRSVGKYRAQYVYVCSVAGCGTLVEPGWLPAWTAIDWKVPGQIIGDRDRPLAEKTRARIAAGIARYWLTPFLAEVAGNTYERRPGVRTRSVTDPHAAFTTTMSTGLLVPVEGRDGKDARPGMLPLRTQTARNETGVLHPGMLVPAGGTWNDDATTMTDPMRALTTRDAYGVVSPGMLPFVAELRGGGSDARDVGEPLATFAANGTHHGLITSYYGTGINAAPIDDPLATVTTVDKHALLMRNNTGGAEMSTPVGEPMRTITTAAHQSLVQHAGPRQPKAKVTDDALAAAARMVDECAFRMLTPLEAAAGMAFPSSYRWDIDEARKISDRDLVKLAGNAVTPPASRDLVGVVAEALGGAP